MATEAKPKQRKLDWIVASGVTVVVVVFLDTLFRGYSL